MESQLLPVYISKLREIQYAVRQQSIIATQQVWHTTWSKHTKRASDKWRLYCAKHPIALFLTNSAVSDPLENQLSGQLNFCVNKSLHCSSAPQVLYTSLNANHEPIVITDDVFRIQYANKAAERLFEVKVVRTHWFHSLIISKMDIFPHQPKK